MHELGATHAHAPNDFLPRVHSAITLLCGFHLVERSHSRTQSRPFLGSKTCLNYNDTTMLKMAGWEARFMHKIDSNPRLASRLATILTAFLVFLGIWVIFNGRPMTKRLEKSAEKQRLSSRVHRAELPTRIISTVHAVFVSQGVLRCLYYEGDYLFSDGNGFTKTSETAAFYFCISVAFFIGDLLICCVQFEEYGWSFLGHAIAGYGTFLFVVLSDTAHYWGCLGLSWEISTVFLNVRWWLLEYKHKDSIFFTINTILLVVVFFIIRIGVSWPLSFTYITSCYKLTSLGGGDGSVSNFFFVWTSLVLVVLAGLNGFWFSKMMRGVQRALSKTSLAKKND